MKRCIIIGRPNVGKTLFAIRFAEFLGIAVARISFAEAGGRRWQADYSVSGALGDLTGSTPHQTRQLQSFTLRLPAGKGSKQFELVDTSGLVDGIHPDRSIRLAMAQTLATVKDATVLLHMLDAAAVGRGGEARAPGEEAAVGEVDREVAHFGLSRGGYLMLANKMDLETAPAGLQRLRRLFPRHPVAPVSALRGDGFEEVKQFVGRCL